MFGLSCFWRGSGAAVLAIGLLASWGRAEDAPKIDGRELFNREWIPKDARSHGGDGLGPLFNDTSCVACHNQGGAGGAGPAAKNAQIVTAFSNRSPNPQPQKNNGSLVGAIVMLMAGGSASKPAPPLTAEEQARIDAQRERLIKVHPGFRTARSVVLHRSSTDDRYGTFRRQVNVGDSFRKGSTTLPIVTRNGEFTFFISERNTIPLFGSGRIDAIPESVLVAAAEKKYDDYPEVSGRVARLTDGSIGRFGWKAQKARLSDFVLTACAVELGLNVPGEPQSGLPHRPDYAPQGLDLNQEECSALTSFIGSLPAPVERSPANEKEAEYLEGGRKLFASAGCAACHTQQLGDVAGIYSDLLLHDMGPQLSDSGSYSGFAPNATEEEELKGPVPPLNSAVLIRDETNLVGATRQEWRTPPLWGLRDSAPYLHDGRAATIEQAIAMHGGEAIRASRQFLLKLSAEERLQLTLFLKSLTAPAL